MNAKRLAFMCILFALPLLVACQPALPEGFTVEKTVVVTQEVMVEGEPAFEMWPATPTPAPWGSAAGAYPEPYEDAAGSARQVISIPAPSRMVIKDAEIELLVANTDVAIDRITQMTVDYGGYIISSQTWYSEEYKYATLRLAIPSIDFEAALKFLRGSGLQVLRETASGQDVTAEYVDLGTQLANLEATAARVRQFLEQATTVEEALSVNQELTILEGQIERVKGQMGYYEGRSALSTVTVSLTPQRPTPTPTPPPGWNPGQTFDDAYTALVGLARGAVDSLIWLVVLAGPAAIVLGVFLWAARWFMRRWRKRA